MMGGKVSSLLTIVQRVKTYKPINDVGEGI